MRSLVVVTIAHRPVGRFTLPRFLFLVKTKEELEERKAARRTCGLWVA